MIAAAFLVLLRPYSIQCALFLLLLLLGTVATILFFCCWHRKLQKGRHPIKSVFSGRSRSRDAAMRSHHFRSEVIYLARNLKGFRPSPRHIRRRVVPRLEETQPLVEVHQLSEQETSVKKRKIKKSSRVQPEFYHSVQVTPTRKPSSGNASYRCSMSSSADFSDDDDFSQKSGSLSPAPGDTLPWNLPKHERSKRKIQGGSVLDPAERAVLRIADERDKVQKKTFTKWINQHLMKVRKHVNDLYEDLRDGHNLISLLEVLSGDTLPRERDFLKTLRLVSSTEACTYEQHEDEEDEDKGPREKGRMRFHRLQNVQIALDYLKRRQVKLVNIRNDDITDGNPKLTLGLIWTIILHFQISDIHVTGESEDMSAKERLLLWTQQTTEGYAGIRCENFTTCWRDGKLFNAIIHKYRPDLIDMNTVAVQSNLANLEHAFFVAEKLGVARLLDPEDVDVSSPDEKSVITYVSSLYDAFPKVPEGGEGISAHDVEVKWVEYQNMVNYLIQWIRHHATMMTDRAFPNNPVELKALYNQYLQFKETEIPPKEIEKSKIKHLYKLLEVWIEFGRIKLPQGYHPNDIEKEWGKLIIAMLEREKTLRPEVERLEMLQQIANRIQRDSLGCEDKLMLARNAVQSDAKRLESGLQFQNEAEIAGYLLECENLLRQQVLDAQILIDGKYYQADQLVQRVAKLRDDLMALRAECSSIYSKGRTLTTEQTKMMISGITQSLNSGFAPNFSPSLNSGLSQGLSPSLTSSSITSGLSSGLSSRMTPAITPAYTPGFPPRLIQSYITGVDTGALQTLKLMQIRKPLMKSAFIDQNLTEEEVNMKFVQDLLRWVDEMQVQLDRAEWGSDLPSVESHLENHKNVHKAIEEFESSLKEAKISEIQMTAPLKLSYADKLHKLESQYAKLLNTSRNQERHLDTLHNFVSRATRELIWLNEKEEEEVAYDWSERNTNIARKKDYHAELMRELDQKEEIIKSVQEIAEQLLFENHPARLTIEAYRAAMQTQWSWILQLCQCVEQHLRENTAYFEFFNDAKEAIDYLKNLRDAVHRKYSCDRSSSIHKLEDLIQESMEEKEQLLQYKNTVAGLVGRAKTIVQLKPRNPDNPLKTSIPIKAICDYRQIEITIYRDDECVLASNSHRAKWKVISPSGNEAMVPSVCFTVPPPNKEAIDTANRIEQQYQNVLALWHESHVNMKSVVSWHYLTNEIETVRASNVASIKTLLPGEHQQVLSNLQSRFDDFLEDSQESKAFSVADIAQLEREVNVCKQYYQELLKSAEREEHEESIYNLYISEVRNMRLRLENCEDRLIRQIRTPLERDDLHESVFRISEQEKLKKDLDRLKEDLETITDKCDDFFSQAAGSPSVPTLRSELNLVIQNMNQVYSMSSIYIEKLKTINLVLKNTQGAEALVKLYETKLCEEEPLTADKSNIENLMATLKQWRSEVDVKREVFHALEDELQKAKAISDQMFKTHKERDLDFDWHKEKADQLTERWQNVHSQIENRLRDLEAINKSLKYYRDTYGALDNWIKQVEETQQRFQENPPQNSKALAKQLNQQKMLVSEIETKQNKLDECQKHSEQYSAAVKDYELQTMTYRAMVDSQQKSPVKRRRMQSSSDFIIQEFMDLRTRYTALVTLMTQYIKFAGDSLKRLEEEEILKNKEALVRGEYSDLEQQQKEVMSENRKLMERINELEEMLDELRKQKFQLEVELPKAKADAEKEMKKQQAKMEEISLQKAKAEQEAKRFRMELEDALKEKEDAEQELERVKQLALKTEAQRSMVEEKFRAFRMQLEETAVARDALEDKLRRKDTNLQDLEQQKKALMEELRKKTAEEEKLVKLIKEMEQDMEFQGSLVKSKCREKEITEVRRQITIIGQETLLPTGSDIFREKQELKNIEEFQQLVDELTFANKKSEKTIKDLKYELCELELQNASAEEKARLLKEKLDDANNSLRRLKVELDQKELVEQGYLEQLKELDRQLQKTTGKAEEVMQEAMDLKKINMKYQEELRSLQKEKALLKMELEELARTHTHTGITIQQLHSQITSLQQEKMAAEQRTVSCRGETTSLQEQLKKMQEQFLQKTREEKENQLKIQRLKDDLADSNHLVEKLKQKVEELSRWNSETKIMMTEVRTDSEKIILERQIIDRKNDELKALAEGFKEQLRITNEQLHKQIILEQEHLDHIKRLEDELIKAKELAGEFKQKCDRDNAYNMNAEMEIRNLRTQMSTFTMEMKMNEQKVQQQQSHIHELNSKMKKLQDDLHQKTLEEQMARQNVALLQEESIAFKHSAEEFRKKFEKLLETHNIAENDISGIRMECITLQQENHMAQDNIRMYKLQIEDLQDRLQKSREQLQQGKHAEMEYVQKYRKMEEELQMHRRTVENLKHQIDLQKRDHGNQLRWFQNEINKRNIQLDFGWKGNGFSYLGDTSPRDFEHINLCTTTSPLLRRRHLSGSSCKSEPLVAQKLQTVATDSLQREKPFQLSGVTHQLENGISQQSYAEYVSQTSTEFEIMVDKSNPITRISEIDKLRDGKLLSSRLEESYEVGLGKRLHPLENLQNEDLSKISAILEEKQAKEVALIPSEYDNIKFQGLRHDVTAKQLIEVKLLDLSTAEQLHSGKKAIAEKSVEEEKKEHVEKAGDLLKWVSNITKSLGKGGGEKSEKADSPKKQISSDELLTKKEQISEALQTTQTFLAKHGDKMTDEEKNEMENHVRSLQEGYKLLSNEDLKQLQQEQDADNENVDEKDLADQHQDFTEKLQDICDLLTQTENQLIGHKEALAIEDTKAELQQYQIKQEELQKDMQANTQALAEIVKNTEMFLKENGEKLRQEDKTALEKKLNEAKTKCLLLSQKAEESRKQLDKAVTTAIKQETEKVAAREQLEESKSTIENLLDWLSKVDKDAEHGGKKGKPAIKQNGNHFQEGEVEELAGEDDEVNGNLMEIQQQNETHVDGQLKPSEDNLNMQYQKAKAQHEKIISQQQAVIIATQSTQALLEKQGHHLSPEEKEKIQRNMKELKVQYETALAESEQKLKLTRSLQEELEKFDADYGEFESWLQQGEQELDNLETGASDFNGIIIKLKRQKSFSEDVISHKGDLRYITISGQRVLDAAKSCNKREGVKYDKEGIDTSSTYIEVQNKLDSATGRFKSLYSKCSILGNNLKDLVDKYQNYEDTSSGLLTGLQASEEAVNKQLSEAVAVDPKNLQRQLEETKVLQGQVSGHQVAVEKLKKAAEVLFDTRGELLPDKDEIQNTLDTIVDKYNHLSKAVNDRNEKLQITLTRSLSVQDGLDEMLDWMNGVEKSLEEQGQVPLNSSVIQDVISKSMALEQDIVGRQSSLNAMKEKLNKFMETTDPSTASSLQAKMNELSQRFCEANNKHRKKLKKLEGLKTKVELFECLTDKLQSFLDKKTQALGEADIPGKDVTEMSLYVQETNTELMEQKKDLENLQHLIEELSPHALPGDRSLVLEKVNALSKKFKEMEETIREKEEDVSSCQKQMDEFNLHVESLKKWVDEMTERIPAIQPSLNVENLNKHLQNTKHLEEEWSSKAPDIQKMISRGTALCNLISAVTSPARSRGVKSAVSGTVLNGEGVATDTQGFLTNKEVTTVQHNMSTVSHSYDDLGAILKEKRSELESTLSNMQNIQRESNSMMEWLQNMDTAAAKWEATLIDSEAVKEQVDQHKLFETELKQNENKVQELKDRVTELLEKNPDSPEAPKWKQMLDKIDSKWRELSQVTADRQKKLEESSNYLTQFQATEAQLKQWLVEKELMVSVLGPLSIDPNMLNTQKQQVQILLNEFDTRKPQYEQLNTAGQAIMKRPGEHPPSHKMVKQQLAAVAQKWDGLTGQLSDRCNRIDQAIVKSTEYQSCLKSLSEKLSVLDDKLNSSLAISTDPDSVKRQLEVAREVKEEIEREMPKRKAAQALCEELSALVAEDYLKAELARQLDGILKPFHDMEQKAGNHIEQLQSTYVSSHQFQQMSKDFQAWLDKKKEEQNQPCPISTKLESLWTLIDDQKEFKAALSDQTGSYEKIITEGESLLQKTQGAEKAELQAQLNLLRGNWDEMNKQVKERQDKLNDCLEKALRYREHVENLQPWIAKCQNNTSQIEMSIDPVRLENSIAQVKSWQKDLDKHQGLVELLSNAAETLLSACQADKEIIEEEKALLIQNMDIVTEQLHAKRDGLEKMSQRLKEFQESSKDVEEQLKNAREQLETHDSLKPQTYSNKHLTIMQAQQKTLQALKAQVDLTKKLAQELVADASDSSGVSDLLLQAETLEEEFSTISQQVEDKCSFLETKLQGIGHFQNSIREMFSQFAEFDDELDSMDSVGRDLVTLQSQRKDIKTFLKKLEELITSNENANNTCKMMLANEAEASPDLAGIKRDLEALNKQCNKLLDRAKARDEQIEGTISRVEEFYSKLKGFSKLLGEVEEHEESQGSVGMEIETINQQLNVFKVFEKEKIEPLQVKQQEVNWLGQGLIQSAAKNASTDNLERDLEDVNTRWKTLNKKVAQRAAQLQEALLHCGRFQDAVESILSWLIDTEDLVANQKPPSAEFKVVKAQIQEQKLLQRLLDDRRPTVELIKREGEKIAESAEPADKEKILKQLSLLDSRWDALLDKAETRNRQLEGISAVAQQFHETLEPLVEWLTITEKRLSNSEPIGTQASKLQQQISQHKAFEEDIATRNKNLEQAINIGQALKALSSKEDKEMVQEKLDSSEAQYTEIREKSGSRAQLLQQAYCNAQIFGEDEVELMNWLNEVHEKLSKLAVQDYNTDLLVKQQTEMLALQEEILLRKQNVDQAIQNGLELLKQTTGDEVVIIQDKLEGIKTRYKDITKLSSDVSKTLEQALQLSGQLQSAHEKLCTWLDKVEVELQSYEAQVPKGEELSQAQERQKALKKEAKDNKSLLDTLNEVSSALLELVPWRAREGIDKMITEDNERYRLVSDTITQKVEEIDAAIFRSQQFDQAADTELAWVEETENKLMSLGDIRLERDQTIAQLQVQKAFTMEILKHKDTIEELVASGDEIMKTCTEEDKQTMKKKLEDLLQKYNTLCQMNSKRNLQLERAQSLASQFWETYEEIWPWLTETQTVISQLPAPALEYETLKQQQEEHRQLRELIAEHKPHIDKMNKTGPQLLELSPREGFSIQEKYVAADALYSRIKEDVKKRAQALDEAISQSTQFHDKIDSTTESLERIVERLRQPPSISAEVEKIKEQIGENKNVSVDLEKLQPVYETLKQRGEEMIARSEGADKDISAKVVQDKLDQMVLMWEDIHTLAEEREAKLLDAMELAEKFWCDHMALIATIKDTQDFIRELEGAGIDPSVVKQQQEAAETIKEEIDGLQEDLDVVVSLGSELIAACGEPDKPLVNKSIDELNSAWDALNKAWKERVDKLEEAMQAAVQYQDGLQAIFDWVDIAGSKLAAMSPVGTDLETVKQQTEEMKQFKKEAYQQQIEMERLNHQAELLLKKVTEESDKHTVQDPLSELKLLWESLEDKIVSRQHKLEGALLALGQFQHALDELLAWLTHTEDLLNEQKPVGGDPKAIEIELAKHHVLQNDVLAHQSTVETVKKAGNDLIQSSAVEEASNLQSKLELLNQRWQNVLEKTEKRKLQLDSALIQAQGFHGEVEDLQQWLTETERQLLASKPVGGLPETAREQLNIHMELCAAFEAKEETYKCLMQKGLQMLARCLETIETNVEQDINNLKEKWESVETKLSERKIKLEEALNLAMEFHNSLQDFINWLTQAEQTLTVASRPSLILDTVLFQIDEHKVFANEVNAHRDQIIELDKTGTHLKYFSQKQDVVLIKNLLISVQSRWEKVVQRLVERGRALDDARKRAKQFHEAWNKLTEWLDDSEKTLDAELEIANDPDKIKMQLAQHKEFQKALGAKHSVYDTTNRSGRALKEKTSLADDNLKLDDMLSELRDKWDTVCGKSVERQNKLEEALLFSGQFTDALQALIDWLYKVEPQLAEDQPVHGDIDLVMNLIDNHKAFQKELGKRTGSVQALKRSARELIEGSRDDSSWVKVQMQELGTRWETVCALSVSKQTRLEQALHQAEEFHSVVHVLLEWLAEAEQALRFHGNLPDDEESLRTLIDQHREFMRKLEEKKAELTKATGMGEAILAICHPDSITTIKHWITIIRARFEEVLAWAKQHQQRLAGALAALIANQELLEALLTWLQWAETTLSEKDKEVIPQEIDDVKALIAEHQTFMEEMTRKQPDVDKVTKTHKRKAAESGPIHSHIPVLDKGRGGRKRSPTPSMYPSGAQAQIETKNPRVNLLVSKWQQVWLLALERRRKLNDALDRLEELKEFANFDFDIWRKKYMRWMNHKKSRVMDFFRRIDKDQDGKITRQEFIDGILSSKFPTSRLEMSAVADIFDRDGDGYIDYYEFVAALHPNKDAYKPLTDADKIEDEVTRQVAKCKCAKRFQVEQIGDNKYRFFLGNQFGDSQQLRLVRILRSTVMVRVGGGWMALDEFLVKNDPCRVHHHGSKMLRSESNSSITTQPTIAKGRTNMELREKFILADGASQSMAAFRQRGRRSRPSSRGASPNRSMSVSNPPAQGAPTSALAASTPKTPHHLTRNYGKPWLINSKTSSPCKPPECSEYQVSSTEGTPIQGSKLRLPGYLSGKGFHSGEDSSLISTAATRVRAHFADTRKTPSRPGSRAGSKAGSRASSRRGSDASDFDISEIQSVCSDVSETVHTPIRPTPRPNSRSASGKPSKIPTPQRKSPASKLDKSSKR
ncbi:dystonin isoform X26 [Podarcis raffonei]|uniref:dystonin isoform X26 n=1 Tax=Podarcis raffonei TaxID=65483 RepID=UPI0023298B3C|nr:dystonin isoform X26 [Podarcis raffonei]